MRLVVPVLAGFVRVHVWVDARLTWRRHVQLLLSNFKSFFLHLVHNGKKKERPHDTRGHLLFVGSSVWEALSNTRIKK
jgi:hypothetical protein